MIAGDDEGFYDDCRAAISALLPQPKDEAEELQRAFEQHCADTGCQFSMMKGWRWLLSQGWKPADHHQHTDRG